MTHRTLILVAACAAFATSLTMVSPASAQEEEEGGACGIEDVQACLDACAAYSSGLPEDAPEADTTEDAIIAHCATLEPCTAASIDADRIRRMRPICSGVFGRARTPVVASAASHPAFCVLPDGTSRDEGRELCQCPEGWYAMAPDRSHSRPTIRGLRIPRGHTLRVCVNPLALSGAPGSTSERTDALEALLSQHDAALRALCDPAEDEDLVAACTRARSEFLAVGSGTGPVDLGPLITQIENLESALEREHELVEDLVDESRIAHDRLDGHDAMIRVLSNRVTVITQCLMNGPEHVIEYTDQFIDAPGETTEHVTQRYTCESLLAAAEERVLTAARDAARRETERVLAEHDLRNNGGRAFLLFQGYALVAGPELEYGNTRYGIPIGFGGELALGVGLGGGWYIRGGLGLGAAFPDVAGMTNVMVVPHLGVGSLFAVGRDVHLGVTFGGIAPMRFLPNGFLGYNLYGGFLELMLRFPATSEWSFVASLRGFAGVVPREVAPGNFEVDGGGGAQVLLGIGHF